MRTIVARVDLSTGSLQTVQNNGQTHVVFKPAVEALGLDYSSQLKRLRRQPWACVVVTTMQLPGDVQARDVVTVPEDTFTMWAATLQASRLPEELRPHLVAFQVETKWAIHDYWRAKGQAIRPQASPAPQIPATFAEALRLAADKAEEAEALAAKLVASQAQVRVLEPQAEVARAIGSSEGISLSRFHGAYFPDFEYRAFFEHLYSKGYCRDERGKRWSESREKWVAGFRHQHPKAKGRPFMYITGDFVDNKGRRQQSVRVRPGKYELDFVRALVKDGLPLNPARTVPSLPELSTRTRKAIASPPAVTDDSGRDDIENIFEREGGAW
jgi:hypothetical protein